MKKQLFFITVLTILGLSANAQWVRQIGATGNDAVKDCVLDKNKNLYITGYFQGIVDFGNGHIENSVNNSVDFFAAKYDQNNNCIWTSTFGTTEDESGTRIFIDSTDGSLYLGIKFGNYMTNAPTWGIGKINSNGTQSWNGQIFGTDNNGQFIPFITDFKQTNSTIEFLIIPWNNHGFNYDIYHDGTNLFHQHFTYPFNTKGGGCVIYLILNKTNGFINSSHIYSYTNAFFTDAKFDSNNRIIMAGGFTGSTQIDTISLTATKGLLDDDGIIASIDISGNCNWVKQSSQGSVAENDFSTGIMVDGNKIYYFNNLIPGTWSTNCYLNCYDQSSGILTYNTSTTFTYGLANFKTSKQNNLMFLSKKCFSIGGSIDIGGGELYCYDLSTLSSNNSFTYLSNNNFSVESYESDSTSLYLAGGFMGSYTFGGTTLTTTPSNTIDGYVFKKHYCFYPILTPNITQVSDTLISSSLVGNQWYNQSGQIINATNQKYIPTMNGIYYDIVTIDGCSSSQSNSIQYCFYPIITPSITQNVDTLFSSSVTGNQWYKNNLIISGATNQCYIFTTNGNYYVIVKQNGCYSDTSNIITITNAGLDENSSLNNISIFPNPVNDNITIITNVNSIIEFLNIQGQIIKRIKLNDTKTNIDISDFSSGVYIIRAQTDSGITTEKFIKE
jgi:hypothetical protein